MPNNRFRISYIIVIILVGAFAFYLGFTPSRSNVPNDYYQIYIDGDMIGMVEDQEQLEEFINQKEEAIKKKYGVSKVYMPSGVVVKKVTTYHKNLDSNADIYKKIVDKRQFTIKGTMITITKKDDKDAKPRYIYTLNKQIFDDAVVELIKSFVDDETYEAYMSNSQKEIVDTGSVVLSIDIDEEITYKSAYISIDETIFTNASTLAKYLLYGTLDKQSTYVVQEGDTVETVANANKLNVQEFLIANSDFKSVNTLLYAGQKVNVGLINPILSVVVQENSVKDEERAYSVSIRYDKNEPKGVEHVEQEGVNGLYRVNRMYKYVNGQLVDMAPRNSVELKPSVDKVIVRGDKEIPHVADLSYWAWPTETPYTITTYYGYRWGSMHAAIDIYYGYGSNVYAANNGTVVMTRGGCTPGNLSCNGRQGNVIYIDHNIGGYYSVYMHLASILVKEGQVVSRGQKIGIMGNTGEVYPVPSSYSPYSGTHLHFATWRGFPNRGGSPFNPLTLYH